MKDTKLAGTYRQTLSWGVETLTLEPDGTFREEFRYDSGESLTNSGESETWTTPRGGVMVRVGDKVHPDFRGPQYGPQGLMFTFRARETPQGRVLEMVPDPDGAVRLMRIP